MTPINIPKTLLIALFILQGTGTALPTEDQSGPSDLQARSSNRKVNLYAGSGCQGNGLQYTESGFGCGGGCHSFGTNLGSIYLEYGGSGPKPTASCYISGDYSGSVVTSAGIAPGDWNGCTNFNNNLHSCYFYYDC
jgi:hypothetical protein